MKLYIGIITMISASLYAEPSFQQTSIINHVKQSLAQADNLQSNLTPEILALSGMSSPKIRHLLNNLCSYPATHYLEIGPGEGSTFIAALYHNPTVIRATAIDNWSGFNIPRKTFFTNINRFLDLSPVTVYEMTSTSVNKKIAFKQAITLFFYDGELSESEVFNNIIYFDEILADTYTIIIDDYNVPSVQTACKKAFEKLGHTILFSQELPARFNGDTEQWWNGALIAVIHKNN